MSGFNVYSAFTASAQLDGRRWEGIKKGLQAQEQLLQGAQPGAGPNSQNGKLDDFKTRAMASSAGPAASATVAPDNPIWDSNLGPFIGAMLILLLSIFRAKEDYTEGPTAEYEAAVSKWQEVLLQDPDTASPRELKRFMNLSRYAVARLQTATAGITAAGADAAKLPIPEARIVELTAKWLVNSGKVKPGAMRDALAHDGANAVEVALFLEIVGELGDGSTEASSPGANTKATSGAVTYADLDRTDKAVDV